MEEQINYQDHIQLARKVLGWVCGSYAQMDDTPEFQDAMIGLWDAARLHDPVRAKYSTYAWHVVRREVLRELGKRRTQQFCGSRLSCKRWTMPDTDAVDDRDEREGQMAWIMRETEKFPPRMRDAIRLRLKGQMLVEIGKQIGVSTERARQLIERAMGRLRERAKVAQAENVL